NSINPGVWRTTNGGTSFNQVTGLPAFNTLDIGIRYGPQNSYIERDATQANVRYFVSRHIGNSPTASTQFYRSTTNGASWSPVSYIFGTGGWVWGLCADPIRTNTLWAAGGGFGVKVSTNGGDTWTPTAQFFDAKHVSSCDGKIAVWGRKDGEPNPELLWYSPDNGVTWTAQSTVANNFHNIQGITVDRNGKIWVSWNSITVVTPSGGTPPPADTQAPTVPTSLSSASITQSSFTLNWAASTDNVGVTAYEVFRGGVSQGTVTGTSFNATGLSASTLYSMTVRARDAAGNNSAQSTALNVTTSAPSGDTQAPTVPTGLSSASITQTSFTLNWSASTDNVGVTTYEVFRGGVSQGTVTGTSFNATGLSASTTYAMTVRATDAAGNNSAQSTALNITTSATVNGTLFTGTITGTAAYNNEAQYAVANVFDGNTNTFFAPTSNTNSFAQLDMGTTLTGRLSTLRFYPRVGYASRMVGAVFQASTNGTSWTTVYTVSATPPETWNSVTINDTNFYRYFRYFQANNFADISEIEFLGTAQSTTDTTAPTVPSGLASASITQTGFTLNWLASTDNVGVTLYEIFRGGVSQGTTAATTFNLTGLNAGTTYAITVRARDSAGNNSAQSTALNVSTTDTTAPTVPSGLASASITQTGFTLNWLASTDNVGVTLYEVFRGGVSQGTTAATTFNLTGLNAGTTYAITVRARDAAGNNSAQSTALNVSTADTPAPIAAATQSFCGSATVANLVATGNNIEWYDAANGGNLLPTTTALVNGVTYYASQSFGACCVSTMRAAVNVVLTPITSNSTAITAINAYTWPINGIRYQSSGIYTHTVACYTEILNLTVNNPEVLITGRSIEIVSGTNLGAAITGTDFGNVGLGASFTRVYTIYNNGSSDLNIGSITLTNNDYTVAKMPVSTVLAGGSTSVSIKYSPTTLGLSACIISIVTNDADENPYTFGLKGNGASPEIIITGRNNEVVSGSTFASVNTGTDFGNINVNANLTRSYSINNTGNVSLSLGAISLSNSAYTVTRAPAASVAPGASTTLSVTYTPVVGGIAPCIVSIVNNDINENPYTFALTGNGLTPEIRITGRSNEIVSGNTIASATLGTNFGNVAIGASFMRSYSITNTGNFNLALGAISLSNSAYTVTQAPAASVAPGASTTLSVTYTPVVGGIAPCIVSIVNNDINENPYTFALTGNGLPGSIGLLADKKLLNASSTSLAGIAIYPNPASDVFNVATESEVATISITSLEGKLMKVISTDSKITEINSQSWPTGIYLIQVKTVTGNFVKKLIVSQR
ncbi:MAG: choice-of-anchor D domain-containing protein, partial [Sphingobacteriales bacterium]